MRERYDFREGERQSDTDVDEIHEDKKGIY